MNVFFKAIVIAMVLSALVMTGTSHAESILPAENGAKIAWSHHDLTDPKETAGTSLLWVGYAGAKTMRCTAVLAFKLPKVTDPAKITAASFSTIIRFEDRMADCHNQLLILGVRKVPELLPSDYAAQGTMIDEAFVKAGQKIAKDWCPVTTSEQASKKLLETVQNLYTQKDASGQYLIVAIRSEKYQEPKAEPSEQRHLYDVDMTKLLLSISEQ